jgi:ubiquinone biosynthesis protein UbiJ
MDMGLQKAIRDSLSTILTTDAASSPDQGPLRSNISMYAAWPLPPLPSLSPLLMPALQDRLVLLINHVLSREPIAARRLQPLAGRGLVVHLAGWPALLPAVPDLILGVTPAGLFERLDAAPSGAGGLRIEIDASNPARLALGALSGGAPGVSVQGDAAFAGEMHWLMDNLRWDIEDDLAGIVGPMAVSQLAQFGRTLRRALSGMAQRLAPSSGSGA